MTPEPDRKRPKARRRWRKLRRLAASLSKVAKGLNPAAVTMDSAVSANLYALQRYCDYASFPIDINAQTWSVRCKVSNRRVNGFGVLMSIIAFKTVAGILSFAVNMFQDRLNYGTIFPMFSLVVMTEHVMALIWGYSKFISNRVTFSTTLRAIVENRGSVTKKRLTHIFLWVMPAALFFTVQAGNVIMSLNLKWITNGRHQVHLAFEIFGAETRGWAYILATALALVLDTVAFVGVGGLATIFTFSHTCFIDIWTDKMTILLRKWEKARPQNFEALWKETVEQRVFLRIYNESHKFSVATLKFGSMILSVAGISALLIFEMSNPLFTYAIAFNGFVPFFGYLLINQKAYDVKSASDETKFTIFKLARKYNDQLLLRRAMSIYCTGIWVGNFRIIERQFKLDFSDFVVNQVIGIVLAANQ